MTVNDAMVEAGMAAFVKTRAWRDREDQAVKADGKPSMRAAIEAAIAVQPVPTDAEIEAAIERYCDARELFSGRTGIMTLWPMHTDDPKAARAKQEALIAEALDGKRDAHSNLLRLIAALADAGYAVVRKSQIELLIDSLEFELEGMMSSRVDDVVGWMKAVSAGEDVNQWMPTTPKWRVADDDAT